MKKNIRPIAINLPQFHPIAENDIWWGKGFTEWTNVTKAQPLFPGHYQPHLPTDLGFYDMRMPETREEQAQMAKQYGIFGFCYYHYWFNGKLLLEKPLEQMLELEKPEMPFMLCWANENWTRRWDGLEQDVLMEQNYNDGDDESHMNYLLPFFKDPRYIKVGDKPVVIVYKSFLLPDPAKTAETWRKVAKMHGIELYLCHMVFSYHNDNKLQSGFDAVVDFEPFGIRRKNDVFAELNKRRAVLYNRSLWQRVLRKLRITERVPDPLLTYNVLDYEYCYNDLVPISEVGMKIFPAVVPGWDNTSRKNKNPTLLFKNSTPEKFKQWVKNIIADFKPYSPEENFIFINAWNEWAEGNHLEPCRKWGRAYLEALKAEVDDINKL